MKMNAKPFLFLFSAGFCKLSHGLSIAAKSSPYVMVTSGISSSSEMCLSGDHRSVGLESCVGAIAHGDGREVWKFQSGGRLQHAASGQCVGVQGNDVSLVDCASAGNWDIRGNGQLQQGDKCLTQHGEATSEAGLSATASSSDDSHGPSAAIDGDANTYWASSASSSSFELDFGGSRRVNVLSISWQSAPKSFSVYLGNNGKWEQVFATSANAASQSRINLGGGAATAVRITMDGSDYYGINSLDVSGPSLRAVVESCSSADANDDARDKYFLTGVAEFDPSAADTLASVVPSLEAAAASLNRVLSDVADAIPALRDCRANQ